MAGRGVVGVSAQAERLHRSVGLVTEVLSAAAGAIREHAAEDQDAVRLRLPADHAGPLAEGFPGSGLQARSARADLEAERCPCVAATRVAGARTVDTRRGTNNETVEIGGVAGRRALRARSWGRSAGGTGYGPDTRGNHRHGPPPRGKPAVDASGRNGIDR